jgi:hypothetical protein
MFGKVSSDHSSASPWKTLLSVARPLSNLKNGLTFIWLHLTQNFQAVATTLETLDKNLILSQSIQCVGLYADGSHGPLVANVLTLEIERNAGHAPWGSGYQQH